MLAAAPPCPVRVVGKRIVDVVTLDGGRTFTRYAIPSLTGFQARAIRVRGDDVTITAKSVLRVGPRKRTATGEVR